MNTDKLVRLKSTGYKLVELKAPVTKSKNKYIIPIQRESEREREKEGEGRYRVITWSSTCFFDCTITRARKNKLERVSVLQMSTFTVWKYQ